MICRVHAALPVGEYHSTQRAASLPHSVTVRVQEWHCRDDARLPDSLDYEADFHARLEVWRIQVAVCQVSPECRGTKSGYYFANGCLA